MTDRRKKIVAAKKSARENALVPFVPATRDFIDAFYAHVLPADLALFTNDERARMAASIWALAETRRKGDIKIKFFNPSPASDGWTVDHTVIEIINDDTPFIVDSVTGVLQNRGLNIHIVIHPIMHLRRDARGGLQGMAKAGQADSVAESFMHIQVDHCFDVAQMKEIESEIRAALEDVAAAVDDWQAMRDHMCNEIGKTALSKKQDPAVEDIEEVRAFLHWMIDDNFTFLGYREIDLGQEGGNVTSIRIKQKSGLGVLRNDEARMFGGLRDFDKRTNPGLRKYVRQNHVLFITKTNAVTRVHRILPMDAVFIRQFDDQGHAVSEKLFVGLFTSKTYAQTPRDIPFMRRKIDNIIGRMHFSPMSHDGRALMHILNTYPHDELFQITEEELYENALGILQLQDRARVALFPRRDPFNRYVTYLIYVPRDRYDSTLRMRIQAFLEKAHEGKALSWHVRIDDGRLARGFVTIRLSPDSPHPDAHVLENELRDMCRSWGDRLRNVLATSYGEAAALTLLRRYGDAFPGSYRDAVTPESAIADIHQLEKVRHEPRFIADIARSADGRLHLKLLQPGKPILLSEALPLIENMGLKVDYMGGPYEVIFKDGGASIFIHEFVGRTALPMVIDFNHAKPCFEEALTALWAGAIENDPFNSLTLCVGLDWRAVTVLRAFARYLRQLRIPYSHEMMAAALMAHPQIAQRIYALFYARHNPGLKGNRVSEIKALEQDIADRLTQVGALEEDRIIRRYVNLVQASLRTNYFQTDDQGRAKNYLSIKFDSRVVEFMPLPKPLYEIFVYSPQTEAVHLRGGKVARGGIRWSDRRDDFRNEILGLMKAQMVKNSVIVPVGSKGGFIVKHPPVDADKFQAEGIACYKIMMQGLLDITDNRVNGKIVPPKNVVRHDNDDPYLVVAADKGTAKFSDIANSISRSYGFWLDDAFASGGSAGYDHKAMGITARGAWEAVKRHFRERGKDIQTTDFTCIGVGDMSGDVFGNGMLLSKHILLTGAFDHRHIFCDPSPDTVKSFAERKRIFALPRSSWADYDRKLISKGGGIFARNEKTIKLSFEMKKAYGISADNLAPADLIQAMLKADVELLYFGGIGTYVKAADETHEEVGDRANESLRINGGEIRAKVVGEGANLGMTQRGRVDYALQGGRLNTDAIDNSAGVDTSDHEVNIKILMRPALDGKRLTIKARDKLLSSMTDEVGHLVLRDNYLQTQALGVAEHNASEKLPAHVRCMQLLEKTGLLNRAVEFLPNDAEIAERQRAGKGLTRPELAVLMAYTKIWLYEKILASDLPDDPAMQVDVDLYFPAALRKNYGKEIAHHQLRREIAATVMTNDIVNRAGLRTMLVMADRGDPILVARAYLVARDAFGLQPVWAAIEALDNKIPALAQTQMLGVLQNGLMLAIERLLADSASLKKLTTSITANKIGLAQLGEWLTRHKKIAVALTPGLADAAVLAPDLAHFVAQVPVMAGALDLISLATKNKKKITDLAAIFFGLETRLGIDWLVRQGAKGAQTPWQRQAVAGALNVMTAHHRRLTTELATQKAIAGKNSASPIDFWLVRQAARLERYDAMLTEWRALGSVDLAMLTLANESLAALTA